MKNSLNFPIKAKLHKSKSIKKNNLWLNDPAFKSNTTLKEYIKHKLETAYNEKNKINKSQDLFKNHSSVNINRKQSLPKKYNSHNKSKSLVNSKIKNSEQYIIFSYEKKSPQKQKYLKNTSSTCLISSNDNYKKIINTTPNNLSKKSISTYSQIKLLKNEINNLLNNNNAIKVKKKQIFDSNYTKKNKNKKTINQAKLLESKIQKLLKNDENENKENECPVPMPYVKRYSSEYNIFINDKYDETEIFKKDLKEPKPEEKVPLPLPLSITNNRYNVRMIKNKEIFISKRSNKSNYNKCKNIKRK